MLGKLSLRAPCAALCLVVMTACSGEPVQRTGASAAHEFGGVDIETLLASDDHANACTRRAVRFADRQYGPDFLPARWERLDCECRQDAMLARLETAAPGNTGLHNALLQLSLNPEVVSVIFDADRPGNFRALADFLQSRSETVLGVDEEDFYQLLAEARDVMQDPAREAVADSPACTEFAALAQKHFPDYADRMDTRLALRSLDYDKATSLFAMDALLFSTAAPERDCRIAFISDPAAYGITDTSGLTLDAANTACALLFEAMEKDLVIRSSARRTLARRVIVLGLDTVAHQTTSTPDDVHHYLADRARQTGAPAEWLQTVFDRLMAQDESDLVSQSVTAALEEAETSL